MREVDTRTAAEIEADIERTIRLQSDDDSLAVLRGDRGWLILKVDELNRDILDTNSALAKFVEKSAADLQAASNRIAELEASVKTFSDHVDKVEGENSDFEKDLATERRKVDKACDNLACSETDCYLTSLDGCTMPEQIDCGNIMEAACWSKYLTTETQGEGDER